ncbi:FecR family protein [Zobellia nedashkovskayae]|uniref:FecR family protein n=1 Tax=Zobellia nedashkovskayae TaxID=2779510 RepID=UPI00188CE5E4|nr:FecR domain-containing protein [Zobellia nedashkovskayae]
MNEKKAKKLFKKYVNNECSQEERDLMERFLESYQGERISASDFRFDSEAKEEVWQKITNKTKAPQSKKNNFNGFILKYAAIFIGLVGLAIVFNYLLKDGSEKGHLIIEDNAIVLKTGDNRERKIIVGGGESITDAHGNILASQSNDQMVYHGKATTELVYNEIIIPKGKTFELKLSDGTLVHLNADTSLKYPVSFIKGEDRKVFLKGEAYFEVAKDPEHKFTVVAKDVDVQVLGTHFNVSCYTGEETYAVLAEGSVAISDKRAGHVSDSLSILKPGQKAAMQEDALVISEVEINDYLNWRNGDLTFNNEPFENIVKKIERRYGVRIENGYTELESIRFRGAFKNETIEDLLDTFKESAEFDYEITNNQIRIKKPT